MAAKKCAREECGKTVYPLEELKCLDKVWHKGCFKCTECGMTLNMKNYKGYNKMPYCEPHYPKTMFTTIVDTPEMRRLTENTKIQSNVKYHEEFEKMKGTKIQIADDPEVSRHMKNTQVISQAAYHGETERKKHMDDTRPPLEETLNRITQSPPSASNNGTPYSNKMASTGTVIYSSEQGGKVPIQQRQVGSIEDYDPMAGNWGTIGSSQGAKKLGKATYSYGSNAPTQQKTQPVGFIVKALYDYTAADTDEVSFAEGDTIVNCQQVDEGWMTGTVRGTGQYGMLPANYVERS